MTFALCGGDLRSVYLVHRLLRDGHSVRCWGLETADIPTQCHCDTMLGSFIGADCIILPIPAFIDGMLHAPFGSMAISADALLAALPPRIPIFAGNIPEGILLQCAARRIELNDLLSIEALAVKNAALTAECTLQLMLQEIPYSLMGESVLILGAGRIGKLLGLKLRTLGAQVTVSARREEDKAWCAALGLIPADTADLSHLLPSCRLLVNTIPAQVLSLPQLQLLPKDGLLFELASKPGGFLQAPKSLTVIHCGGLPGKYAPRSAADAIAETIYHRLEC